ncbi:general odorant-binding protein 56a [Drosophila mojavensis]|uniref:Odorant-binding protein 47a n=1 Tax=Drosophila mojavensis TaxID=7230 RepID=B4KPZ1_DROMO|nr:general odorant-binding protein 56a [Drosophila mojavensis]EDW08093.2 Odorant-binding protein 47a [Drosophila mojavensis]
MSISYLLVALCFLVGAESRYAKVEANLAVTVIEDTPRQFSADQVRLCAQQTELSLKELLQFHTNDATNVTEATQCFTHCLYEQMGLMHDGVFVEQDLVGHLSDAINPTWWPQRACHSLRGANKCETAHKIHQCIQQVQTEKFNLDNGKAEATASPVTETNAIN